MSKKIKLNKNNRIGHRESIHLLMEICIVSSFGLSGSPSLVERNGLQIKYMEESQNPDTGRNQARKVDPVWSYCVALLWEIV
jgi:hypothetical protein